MDVYTNIDIDMVMKLHYTTTTMKTNFLWYLSLSLRNEFHFHTETFPMLLWKMSKCEGFQQRLFSIQIRSRFQATWNWFFFLSLFFIMYIYPQNHWRVKKLCFCIGENLFLILVKIHIHWKFIMENLACINWHFLSLIA